MLLSDGWQLGGHRQCEISLRMHGMKVPSTRRPCYVLPEMEMSDGEDNGEDQAQDEEEVDDVFQQQASTSHGGGAVLNGRKKMKKRLDRTACGAVGKKWENKREIRRLIEQADHQQQQQQWLQKDSANLQIKFVYLMYLFICIW